MTGVGAITAHVWDNLAELLLPFQILEPTRPSFSARHTPGPTHPVRPRRRPPHTSAFAQLVQRAPWITHLQNPRGSKQPASSRTQKTPPLHAWFKKVKRFVIRRFGIHA